MGPILRRWLGTVAVGQMITEKPVSVFSGQAPESNAPLFQPPPEVLDHAHTAPNAVVLVTIGRQINREVPDYYVKVTPRNPATDRGSRDGLLSCGEIGKTLHFHRFRHSSPYPSRTTNTNTKSNCGGDERRTFR